MNRKYAVVDIETTGNNLDSDEIIQVGIAIVQNKKIIETYDTFIACNNEIPAFIQSLTKIDAFDLVDAPNFSHVASHIIKLLDGCVFVAHNVQFDLRFLQSTLVKRDINFSRAISLIRLTGLRLSIHH